jgi:hypothetical protein
MSKLALHEAVQRVLERLLLERVEVPALLGDRDEGLRVALLDVAVDQEPAAVVAAAVMINSASSSVDGSSSMTTWPTGLSSRTRGSSASVPSQGT